MSYTDRVVALVDMDCFYCQVEENLNSSYKGKPLAVVQYNAWKGGGIIAVNYPARERGVTRHMRGDEAKQKCSEIELVRVPNVRGKADLSKYREAGKVVAKVLQKFTPILERASVDEAYLDITAVVKEKMEGVTKEINLSDIKNTHVAGDDVMNFLYNLYNSDLCSESNLRLAFGAVIVEEIRSAVLTETGYTCSAGIAHNKILAKLASGLNKPNKQTILPQDNILEIYKNLPVHKIQSLGGKFGEALTEDLGIRNMAELSSFTEKELLKHYDKKTASWLYNIARGIDYEPVTRRLLGKSIACCKKFPGKSALIQQDSVEHWLNELASEIIERLDLDYEENKRKARQLVVSFSQDISNREIAGSRTIVLRSYDVEKIVSDALDVIRKNCLKPTGDYSIKFLGLSAGKFEDHKSVNEITSFFRVQSKIDKSEDTCNFSDSTIDLNEDISSMNFFQENCVEDSMSDCDSISNELSNINCDNDLPQENDPSFFLNYIGHLSTKYESPIKRDFDTSLALEHFSDDDSSHKESVLDNSEASTSSHAMSENIFSTCKECKKKILDVEMVSHMDYHFALEMVRKESNLYKNNQHEKLPESNVNVDKKALKRKVSDTEKNSIMKFLQTDLKVSINSDTGELCSECNTYIQRDGFVSHLDFHTAKKLHMEINPVSSSNKVVKIMQHKKKPESKRFSNKTESIKKFFKPTI